MLARSRPRMTSHLRPLRGLQDAYCDIGYYYDPSVDNCVPMPENSSVCDIGYSWSDVYQTCMPTGGSTCPPGQFQNLDGSCVTLDTSGTGTYPTTTLPTDNGNSQIWAQIIASAGRIATQIIQATSTQYQTPYGTFRYGTGPYSGLTPTYAQQYLASRSTFGGMSNQTLLLMGAGLLALMFIMKR